MAPPVAVSDISPAVDKIIDGHQPSALRPDLSVRLSRGRRLRNWLLAPEHLVPFVVVCAITAFFWRHTLPHLATQAQSGQGEAGMYFWWLGHFPWAVLHGHNPLVTGAMNVPDGVNATWNTSVLTPALLMSPVTVFGGVILAFNVAVITGMAATALACYAACRRFVAWWPAALFGGLLAGFSPFVLIQARGHLNIFVTAVPALLLLVGHELVVRQRWGRVRLGLLLGALVTMQFGVSTEFLASAALMALVGVLLLAALYRRDVQPARLRYAAGALGVGVATAGVLLAFPLYTLFFGRQHLTGPAQNADRFAADLLSPIVPTSSQWLAPKSLATQSDAFTGNHFENTGYVGITLLLAVLAIVWLLRRVRTVVWAALMAGVALVLSLGRTLHVNGHGTGFPLPWALIRRLPLLESAAPVRYSFYTMLFAGLVIALGADALRARIGTMVVTSQRRTAMVSASVAGCLLIALPVLPSKYVVPYRAVRITVPAWFTASDGVKQVPDESVAVVYPYLSRFDTRAMTYQAVANYRYRQPGIYGFTPGTDGDGRFDVPTITSYVEGRLNAGVTIRANFVIIPRLLAEWRKWGVQTIAVVESAHGAKETEALYTAILHQQPVHKGGVAAYYNIKP